MLKGSGKPRPYKSPRIELSSDSTGAKKEWRDVSPEEVKPGDIIQGKGLVVSGRVTEVTFDGNPEAVKVVVYQMKNGTELRVQNQESIRAFVQVQGG